MSVKSQDHFVIVGGGHAAGSAVKALRACGYNGRLTIIGKETELPYERPQLSKGYLMDAAGELSTISSREWYDENNIDLRLGCMVLQIDRSKHKLTFSDDQDITQEITYDRLLLVTGGRPRPLDIPGVNDVALYYLRTHADANRLRSGLHSAKHLLIIGGGFIGLETAAAAQTLGLDVTLIEAGPRLMSRAVPEEISNWSLNRHRFKGVDVRVGECIHCFTVNDGAANAYLSSGEHIGVDIIVAGIGMIPNDVLAKQAGLDCDNGVLTDPFCRTSDPDIFAAGDVASQHNPLLNRRLRLETWHNAETQAAVAARNMVGHEEHCEEVPWVWSDQYNDLMQIAGAPEAWNSPVMRHDPESDSFVFFQLEEQQIVGAAGINARKEMAVARRLIFTDPGVTAEVLTDPSVSLKSILKQQKYSRAAI